LHSSPKLTAIGKP